MNNKETVENILNSSNNEDFMQFDLSEVQEVLRCLKNEEPIDLAHAEKLTQKALRGSDVLSELLGKITKIVESLESQLNRTKNKISLEYRNPDGKTTADQRKFAAESSPELENLQEKLAKAKGTHVLLKLKFDTIGKTHYHYKEIANGLRKPTWP